MGSPEYVVRVNGDLEGLEGLDGLDGLGVVEVVGQEVTTVLSGTFDDTAALSDLLRRLRAHGLEVVEIRRVADPAAGDGS